MWSEIMIAPNQLLLSKMKDISGRCTLHIACIKHAPENVIDILIANNMTAVQTMTDNKEYPLLKALQWHQSETVVLKILRAFPEAAKYKHQSKGLYKDFYPLHMALDDRTDQVYGITLVKELIKAFPEAVTQMVSFGRYPLHLACHGFSAPETYNKPPTYASWLFQSASHTSRFKVIHELITAFPDAVESADADGMYPLSFFKDEAPEYLVETLLANDFAAIRTLSDDSNNPLISSMEYHQLEPVLLKLLRTFPEAAKQKQHIYIPDWYPLHMACDIGKYETLVIELLKIFPEAAKHMDDQQRYPLNLACFGSSQSSLRVIQELITVFPDAVRHKDKYNRFPLCGALSHYGKVIKIMLEEELFPKTLQPKYGRCLAWFPLNYVSLICTPDIVALKLLELYPQAAKEKECHGWYPLHFACLYSHLSEAVAIKLIELFPEAIQQKTNSDEYPLHIACTHNPRLSIIKALVSHYPNALLEQCVDENGQKFFPLDLAITKNIRENIKFLRDATCNQLKYRRECRESSGNSPLFEVTEDNDHDDCAQGKFKQQKL